MTRRVVIVDYGIGNLHSVVKAFRHEGGDVTVSSAPQVLASADRLVIPGVGAFRDGMQGIHERGLVDAILDFAATQRPLLGICLGMQLLMSSSAEFGSTSGLGLVPGKVVEIDRRAGHKVPQIGWNRIYPASSDSWKGSLLSDLQVGVMVYFVHSYTAMPLDDAHRLADATYADQQISAAVQRDNVIGCQFHPEKSGPAGLSILRRYLAT